MYSWLTDERFPHALIAASAAALGKSPFR